MPPAITSVTGLSSAVESHPGAGWSRSSCSFGSRHATESTTNETIRTIAAAQMKSQTGIGRSSFAASPWAAAEEGSSRAAPKSAEATAAPARRSLAIATRAPP